MAITTVIIKPTKFCNADCSYCSAPPEVNGKSAKWDFELFRSYFDKIKSGLAGNANLVWHGGEPMLMGPDFYVKSYEYARSALPNIRFSMQTNLLSYSSRWKPVFDDIFKGEVSTSFDPDERNRTIKGNTALYTEVFMKRLNAAIDDGFRPMVIGTYSEETIDKAFVMYDLAKSWGERAPALRFNYRYPAGRDALVGPSLSPETYGKTLLALYDRWIVDVPDFTITPLDQMLKKTIGLESTRCPWAKNCGGQFLEIEPNGDVYNCSEFADLADPEYRFGNIGDNDLAELMASDAAKAIRRRRYDVPTSCQTCPHFEECEGGCARDSVLFGRGLGGKFFYCQSWMMLFDRIKESVATGEADAIIRKYNRDPDNVRLLSGYPALEAA